MSAQKKLLVVVLATLGGLLVLCLVCGSVGAALHIGQPAAQFRPAPATTAAAPSPVPSPARTTAKPAPIPVGQLIAAWWANGGRAHALQLSQDLGDISTSGTAADFPGTRAAAVRLAADVRAAQGYAPVPDAEAQGYWAAALEGYGSAARDVIAGIDGMDSGLLDQASAEMSAATVQVRSLTARIRAVGGVS